MCANRRSARSAVAPEAIVELMTPALRPLAEATRELLRRLVPDVLESGRLGWNLIGYRRKGYFAFVAEQRDSLRLGFEHGVLLQDPEVRLQGEGKQVRWVPIRSSADLEDPVVHDLIRAAVAFDELRAR